MNDKYLIHARTKGSKNGVRLYQNEDGTWTAIGLARRRAQYEGVGRKIAKGAAALGSVSSVAGGAVASAAAAKSGNGPATLSTANATSSSVKSFNQLYDQLDTTKGNERYDMNDISDAQLDYLVQRLRKEKELNSYLNEEAEAAKKGKMHLSDVLAIVGTLSTVAVSAATIFSALKGAGAFSKKPEADAAPKKDSAPKKSTSTSTASHTEVPKRPLFSVSNSIGNNNSVKIKIKKKEKHIRF